MMTLDSVDGTGAAATKAVDATTKPRRKLEYCMAATWILDVVIETGSGTITKCRKRERRELKFDRKKQ